MRISSLLPVISFIFIFSPVIAQSFYKNTDVLELDPSNFKEIVLNTNQTSIVEFYAPWCGHCQNLKPHYIKAGQYLDDIANVAAVNCDLGKNKKICAEYRIEGYPTLVAFRPPKFNLSKRDPMKYGHATEVYAGTRKSKPIVDFVTGRIKNYVKRLATEDKLYEWLKDGNRPKIVVFPRKDKLSPLLKSVAVEYLGDIDFAYLPLKDAEKIKSLSQNYEIDPNGSKAVVYFFKNGSDDATKELYTDEFSKEGLAKFIQQFDDLKECSERIFNRLDILKSVKKGQKINNKGKKKSKAGKAEHDEL